MTEEKKGKQKRKKNPGIKGFGSVYLRGSDGRYVARFKIAETGKWKELYAKTQKDAFALLEKAWYEQKQGILASGPNQKLKDYIEQWFEEVHKPTLRIGTYVNYRKILNKHIIPDLGDIPIQKLTAQRIQSFYTAKHNEGLSYGSIRNVHKVLKSALDNAVRWKIVGYNVCKDVSIPQEEEREASVLTPEQARHLLKSVQGHSLEVFVTLALTTGMRHGEIVGLQWDDVNLEEGYLYILHNVSHLTTYKYVEGRPKNEKGKRKILLLQFVIQLLKRYRTKQIEMRLKMGEKWQDHNLVCTNVYGGYMHDSNTRQKFYKLLDKIGLPRMRIHDLRHSCATLLLSLGIHPKVVQEILGHSQISMTMNRYSHVLPSLQKEAAEKLNNLLNEQF